MSLRVHLAALGLPLLCLVVSCGPREAKPGLGRSASPIIHGVLDTGTTHDAVVALVTTDDAAGLELRCTGTLIAPNVVVTARHCVSHLDETIYPPQFRENYPAASVGVFLHADAAGLGPFHGPDAKGVRIVHEVTTTLHNNDFALVVTNIALPVEYAQVRIASAPRQSESVFVLGYGVTETTTDKTPTPYPRFIRDPLSILEVGPLAGGIGDRELTLGESICQGDSGGPVMDHDTSALLAVTSRGGNGTKATAADPARPCVGTDVTNIFTRLDGNEALIRKTLADYGRIPWEEDAPKPPEPTLPLPPHALGGYCANDAACISKLCISVDEDQLCSQACDDATPCPAGFDCNGGYCTPAQPKPPPRDAGVIDSAVDAPAETGPSANDSSSSGCSLATRAFDGESKGMPLLALGAIAGLIAARARRG